MLEYLKSAMHRTWVITQAVIVKGALRLPEPAVRFLAGRPRVVDGHELCAHAQLLLRLQRLVGRDGLTYPDVGKARLHWSDNRELLERRRLGGVEVTQNRMPTPNCPLSTRLYRPVELTGPSSLLIYFHGGGWVLGDLDSHDDVCRFLAKRAGIRVLSVDYRLAPEHQFPAAVDDAIEAFRYAVRHPEEFGTASHLIAVGGDSAGGNLAAVVAHHTTRYDKVQPLFQFLLYPSVDATVRRPSREMFGKGLLLNDSDIEWFFDHYVPDARLRTDHRLSVLHAEDLTGLPPAYVATGGFDPLRDEGEAFARRLQESGVPVISRRFPDMIHGFVNLRQAGGRFGVVVDEVAEALRSQIAVPVR